MVGSPVLLLPGCPPPSSNVQTWGRWPDGNIQKGRELCQNQNHCRNCIRHHRYKCEQLTWKFQRRCIGT
jgi:hypothetical protein